MKDLARFLAYVESVRSIGFQWGCHDCLTFANNAAKEYRGFGFADDWLGGYDSDIGAAIHSRRLLRQLGFSGIVDAVDSRLKRFNAKYPPRGSIVGRPCNGILGYAFGVVVSERLAFVGKNGLDFLKKESTDIFWSL